MGGGGRSRKKTDRLIHWTMAFAVLVCGGIIVWGYTVNSLIINIVKGIFWLSFYLLMYIYVGYPLVLQGWSLLVRKKVRKMNITPTVTLLVCAYNEEECIAEKIENSLSIDYPKDQFRIVIASDGSTDRTNNIVRGYNDPRIHFIPYEQRAGKIGAIIKTIPAIDSDIVVFSDANTMIKTDSVRHIVSNFHDSSVGAVSSDVIVLNDLTSYGKSESLYYKYERWIQKMETNIGSIVGVDGGLYAIRRELYVEPSADIILDDFVISMNTAREKGTRLVYDGDAVGYEESANSYKTEFSKKSRVVAGGFQALIKKEGLPLHGNFQLLFCYVSHKLLRWLTPFFLITLYLSSWILTIQTGNGYVTTLTLLQTLFYTLAYTGTRFKGPIKSPYIYIPFYFSLVNTAALFGFFKGILNKQSVKWEVFKR